jgi:hypothetical protein
VIPRKVRAAVLARDNEACVCCGQNVTYIPYSIHHRKPRQMGGTNDPRINGMANLLTLCGTGTTGCHGYIESHRDEARETGYLLRSVEDAPTTPVLAFVGWLTFSDEIEGAA